MTTRKKVLLMIAIGIGYFIFDTLLQAGSFISIENHNAGNVLQEWNSMWGPEDLEWDRAKERLYISSSNRRSKLDGTWDPTDGIFLLDTKNSEEPIAMSHDLTHDFHPHGISHFTQEGKDYLYVINHISTGQQIELFEIQGTHLAHVKSYANELMTNPNDVVGDAVDQFYVSNDHGNTSEFGLMLENYLRLPYAYILYCDGENWRKVQQGLVYANGVQLSNDGEYLYTCHTIGHELFVWKRNKATGEIKLEETIAINSGLDNIDVDENGDIWVVGHPKLFQFTSHVKSSENLSAVQVFQIKRNADKYSLTKRYEGDGTDISAGSVFVGQNDTGYIGCVFDNKMIRVHFPN